MFLDKEIFKEIIVHTPLVSIDLLIKNSQGQYMLGYRNNRPARGYWFVPGGRIYKNESMSDAFNRLTKVELGEECSKNEAKFLGTFEHLYDDYVFGTEYSTHYVVLGYELTLDVDIDSLPKEQHNQYRWFSSEELLERNDVHKYTKWYLSQ